MKAVYHKKKGKIRIEVFQHFSCMEEKQYYKILYHKRALIPGLSYTLMGLFTNSLSFCDACREIKYQNWQTHNRAIRNTVRMIPRPLWAKPRNLKFPVLHKMPAHRDFSSDYHRGQ